MKWLAKSSSDDEEIADCHAWTDALNGSTTRLQRAIDELFQNRKEFIDSEFNQELYWVCFFSVGGGEEQGCRDDGDQKKHIKKDSHVILSIFIGGLVEVRCEIMFIYTYF